MTTQQLQEFVDKYFPPNMQLKINPFKIFFNMIINFLNSNVPPNINNLVYALFGIPDISNKTIKELVNDPTFNGTNLIDFIKYRDSLIKEDISEFPDEDDFPDFQP